MKYLDYTLTKKVDETARRAALRSKKAEAELVDYWTRLSRVDLEDIWQKLSDHPNTRWNGAVPVYEPAGISQKTSAAPIEIIAVDGSQINPDPDMPCRWAYVQAVAVGSKEQSVFRSDFIDFDSLVSGEITRKDLGWLRGIGLTSLESFVDYLRTTLELDVCLEAGTKYPGHLILWDHPLIPLGAGSNKEMLRSEYDKRFSKMEGVHLAGLVSGPRSHMLADLIALSEAVNPNLAMKARLPIDDIALIRQGVPVGQRSAVFRYGTPFSQRQKHTGIYFFFIRVTRDEVARIEIPEWIGEDPEKVAEVHATILKDSAGIGYPMSLLNAHNSSVISLSLGQELNLRAWATFTTQGGRYHLPAKLLAKKA